MFSFYDILVWLQRDHKDATLITAGNLEDNLDLIGDSDFIIEVVLEKLEIKHVKQPHKQ